MHNRFFLNDRAVAFHWLGIRGNFGYETGAMIPGALAALAAVILFGREDWLAPIWSLAFFGALGLVVRRKRYMQLIA